MSDKGQRSNEILKMLQTEKPSDALEFVKTNYHDLSLTDGVLGALFLAYLEVVNGWEDEDTQVSQLITIDELCKINTSFRTQNGCIWAASDRALGRVYLIDRIKGKGGKVCAIKLLGLNDSLKKHRGIRADIRKEIQSRRCAILDIGKDIEVDHKNGRYDDARVADTTTQTVDDFQALSKAANDAKRQHCKVCTTNRQRYNAQNLGYKEGWTEGDASDTICRGCYWYDPQAFNRTISKDFHKDEDGFE